MGRSPRGAESRAAADAHYFKILSAFSVQRGFTDGDQVITQYVTAETQKDKMKDGADKCDPFAMVFERGRTTAALEWAVFGCLVAGAVGISKALIMDSPLGVLFACSVR